MPESMRVYYVYSVGLSSVFLWDQGIVKSDELEIGRILYLKSEIKKLKLDKPIGLVLKIVQPDIS